LPFSRVASRTVRLRSAPLLATKRSWNSSLPSPPARSRSDLPSDDAIDRAAWNVGKKRGWGNIDYATLSQRSTQMYQQLQQDSTPETTKCSQFNRQLAPFIDSLRSQ